MIEITLALDTIDEVALLELWKEIPPGSFGTASDRSRAWDLIDAYFNGHLQIADGERALFRTEGDGPGERVNILGVLFSAYAALEQLPEPPNTLERGFWPDADSLFFSATPDGRMRIALTTRHWVVGTRDEWRAALDRAFDELRAWIRRYASYLEDNDLLRPWINGEPPPDLLGPFV